MDINSDIADHLFHLLLIGGPAGLLTERTIHLAMMKMSGTPMRGDKLARWFGLDSVIFSLTLIASLISLLPAVLNYSLVDVKEFLDLARDELGFFGWVLTIMVFLHCVAPFIVGFCLTIGRRKRIKRYGVA